MGLKVYSANEVSLIFGAIPIDSGLADDTFLEVSTPEPRFSSKRGIDGSVTMIENKAADAVVMVKVHLMQSSGGNDILSAIFNVASKVGGGATGVLPAIIRDQQGTSILVAAEAYLTKMPDQNFAKEVGTVTWEMEFVNPERFVGGNSEV